jgi:hypothetical protein
MLVFRHAVSSTGESNLSLIGIDLYRFQRAEFDVFRLFLLHIRGDSGI